MTTQLRLILEPTPSTSGPFEVRARRVLKHLLRAWRLKCVRADLVDGESVSERLEQVRAIRLALDAEIAELTAQLTPMKGSGIA